MGKKQHNAYSIQFNIPIFREHLIQWFQENQRPLPWRNTVHPYPVWISEVMLQQTQVKTVIPYFHRFMKAFPDVFHLAQASLQTVLKLWEGLGYYARARNLHRAAQWIVNQRNGEFPNTCEEWKQLPGVGEYIAAAVASIVYQEVVPVIDGNVKRVISRLMADPTPVNTSRAAAHYRNYAKQLIDPVQPGNFNQAIMELGATVCTPRNPKCSQCPVATHCQSYRNNSQIHFPTSIKRSPIPTVNVAVGVVIYQGKVLITQRKAQALLGGLWEFPGGKIEASETPQQACQREILEETGVPVKIVHKLAKIKHAYTHFRVSLWVFICEAEHNQVTLKGAVAYRWLAPKELHQYPFPGANRKFFPQLMAYFQQRGMLPTD